MKNKIVVLSGGLDSTVLLHKHHKDVAMAVYFDYGQNQREKELHFCKLNCEELGIPLEVINLDFFKKYGGAMTSGDSAVPTSGDLATVMEVPFRNGVLFNIVAMIAESKGLSEVVTGTHFGSYPDNNPEYIKKLNESLSVGTHNKIKINFDFAALKKKDIVSEGNRLNVDFTRSWSCYRGGNIHCGRCKACMDRKNAFKESGVLDPTKYEKS